IPGIAALVLTLILLKSRLQGFMAVFPMVTVFAAYESRHSLRTMSRQIPVMMLTMIPMMIVIRLTQHTLGLGPSLMLGWAVLSIILAPLTWYTSRSGAPALEPVAAAA